MLTVHPALPRWNHNPATDSTPDYATPDQSESVTEGGTGDSGFEEPLLKVPLNPKGELTSVRYMYRGFVWK